MMFARLMLLVVVAGLAACGPPDALTCEEGPYKTTVRAPRVQAPDDLDELETFKEIPLPQASPQVDRPEDAPCLEKPPMVIGID